MGFKYVSKVSRDFVGKERKAELIETAEAFEITKVRWSDKGDYGPQFYLSVRFQDDTTGTMTFSAKDPEEGGVVTRNDQLQQLQEYLEANEGESVVATLRREGQTNLIDIEEDEE